MDSFTRDNFGAMFGVLLAIVLRFVDFNGFLALSLGIVVFYLVRLCVPLSTPAIFSSSSSKGVALVSGGTLGIGHAIVEVLLKDGWKHVIIVARPSSQLTAVVDTLKTKFPRSEVTGIGADLSLPSSWESLSNKLKSELNAEVDLLVNNAGFGMKGEFKEVDLAIHTGIVDLNANALVALTRLFLPSMISRRHGMIVQIASTAAFQPCPGNSVYAATKSFVCSFTEALAYELRGSGVHTLCVCPGPVATGFQTRANMSNVRLMKWLPVQTAKEVAEETYTAMKKGSRTLFTGMNGITPAVVQFLPQSLVLWISHMLMSN